MDNFKVDVSGNELMDALFATVGDDFDGVADFEAACRKLECVTLSADIDPDELAVGVKDEWIEAEYRERFGHGNPRDNRDLVDAFAAVVAGRRDIAIALIGRSFDDEATREQIIDAIRG